VKPAPVQQLQRSAADVRYVSGMVWTHWRSACVWLLQGYPASGAKAQRRLQQTNSQDQVRTASQNTVIKNMSLCQMSVSAVISKRAEIGPGCIGVMHAQKFWACRGGFWQVTVYYDIGGVQPEQAQAVQADLGGTAAISSFQHLLQSAGAATCNWSFLLPACAACPWKASLGSGQHLLTYNGKKSTQESHSVK
jgi:hypothetical protein